MNNQAKILAFAGSTRLNSLNKKLVKIAAQGAKLADAEVTYLDLRDLPMPLYDADLEIEEGMPNNVLEFRSLMKANQGLLISCPEYNGSITAVLKNAIDWASRPDPVNMPKGLQCFQNKVAVIMSASPGSLGGIRGLVHVRAILGNLGVLVLPEQKSISQADTAFDEQGNLKDENQQTAIQNLGFKLTNIINKLF